MSNENTMKPQGRRVMPTIRNRTQRAEASSPGALTFGDLVAAAFDTLRDTDAVTLLLASRRMSNRIGRKLVFI
jgi:hypothetical protein